MITINIYNFLNYAIQIFIASIVAFVIYRLLKERSSVKEDFVVLGDKLYKYSQKVQEENKDREELVKKLNSKLNPDFLIVFNKFQEIMNKKYDKNDEFIALSDKVLMIYDPQLALIKFSNKISEINQKKDFFPLEHVEKVKERWESEFHHYYLNILLTIFLSWFGLMVLLNNASNNSVFYVNLGYIPNLIIFLILSVSIFINIVATVFYSLGSSKKHLLYVTLTDIYGLVGIMFTPFISSIWSGSILLFSIYYLLGIAITLPIILLIYKMKSIRSYLNVSFLSGYIALAIIEMEILLRIIIFIKTYA